MNESNMPNLVLDCLSRNYGLEGSLERLPGENLNYLLSTATGRRYVLKIVDQNLAPEVVDLEFAATKYAVAAGFEPRLPQMVENKYGNIETGIKMPMNGLYRMRVLTFLDGTAMSSLSDISIGLMENVGETLARFRVAMQGFDHQAAHRDHRWNLATAGQHERKIQLIGDREKEGLLAWAFRGWRAASERFGSLPWQFIHGDAHDENLLVDGDRVTGLIDFGDCCHNPSVSDLAISMTYLMMRGADPLPIAAALTRGYQRVRFLSAEERAVLYPLISARLAVSVLVANERKAIDPSNPNWFGGERAAWRLLGQLRAMDRASFMQGLFC